MTSRRSRLKAVTNLPVRRKVLTAQENAKDASSVEDLTSEKAFSCNPKPDEILTVGHNTRLNLLVCDISSKKKGTDSLVKVNCAGFQRNESFDANGNISGRREPEDSETLENSDVTKTCNFPICKADSNISSVYVSDDYVKLNSVSSSLGDKPQILTVENEKGNEILLQQNCITDFGNNFNNNIVEDGFKCYTVLTPQNMTINSLTEYSIAPLVSCGSSYTDTSLSGANSPQEFEQVQIYSETEATELFINNDIDENSESVIESAPVDPVLTRYTNYNSENEVNYINTNIVEVENNFKTSATKPVNTSTWGKSNICKSNEQPKSSSTQKRDLNALERTISSGSLKVSPDYLSYKQMSTARRKRIKYNDYTKRLADAKKEFQRKYEKSKPDRSSLRMIDLIFYNPSSNPMESKAKFEKKDAFHQSSDLVNDLLDEERVDEPEILDHNSRSITSDNGDWESANKMPVPQVKIGLDGEIILDERSVVIETTDAKKGREGLQSSVPVFEDRECKVSYYRGKSKKTRDWSNFETKRFYKALNTIGPDFTLMQKYFPKRSRLELKNKFKREERLNRALIDKALNNPSEFDMTQLEKDLAIEKEAEEGVETRFRGIVKQTTKRPRTKSSFLSREMVESDGDLENSRLKSLELKTDRSSEKERNKKGKEFDFVFQKLLRKESKRPGAALPEISSPPKAANDSNCDDT